WQAHAQQALKELTDPSARYLPRAETHLAEGQIDKALAEVTEGLKAIPDNAQLLALRSQAYLEQARTAKKVTDTTPGIKEARADAKAAREKGAEAEGSFAEGRVYEELENWDEAAKSYRAALEALTKANKANDPAANRYKLALGRVLVQKRLSAPEEK